MLASSTGTHVDGAHVDAELADKRALVELAEEALALTVRLRSPVGPEQAELLILSTRAKKRAAGNGNHKQMRKSKYRDTCAPVLVPYTNTVPYNTLEVCTCTR